MQKTSNLYRRIYRLFDSPVIFDLNQIILDGGKRRQIKKFLAGVPRRSILDIGCGTGNWATLTDGPYLGIDTSASFIAGCERRFAGDPSKRFLLADAATLALAERYDLAMMVSVLHHLSDAEVLRLLDWLSRSARRVFILDLYPVYGNPISRWLYRMDRGDFIREPEAQRELMLANGLFALVKEGSYYSPNRLYRHTLFLLESRVSS